MFSKDCSLLISSCDSYDDLWRPFFTLLKKNWPDCAYKKYLITENKKFDDLNVLSLSLGLNLSWSSLLIKALDKIETPYVLLMLEDFFIHSKVDNKLIQDLLQTAISKNMNLLRLNPRPGPTRIIPNVCEFGILNANSPYRVSTQGSIWKKSHLRKLIVEGESAWEFEINGTTRSSEYDNYFCVWKDCLSYGHHVVERGKWFPWELWKYKRKNIGIDLKARKSMSARETCIWLGKKFVNLVLRFLKQILSTVFPTKPGT